jgi:aminoglycoside 6'-N-acetyltransferase
VSGAQGSELRPTLHGDRVALRPLSEADLSRVLQILQQPDVSAWWPGYTMPRLRADTLDAEDATPFVIELQGELVGLAMYTEQTDPYYISAGIDIALDTERLGQGLGSDALRTLARHLFETLGHHRLTIDPALANERAIAAYQKVGFKPVGVMRAYELGADGTWHNNLLLDMLAGDLR